MDKPFSAYKGDQPYLFVCYAHRDSSKVYKDMAALKAKGLNLWYDEGIPGGTSWRAEIAQALSGAKRVLFFISPRSLASGHCTREIRFALDHDVDILPVYLQECELPAEFALALGGVQAIYRSNDERYLEQLYAASAGKVASVYSTPPTSRKSFRSLLLIVCTLLALAGAITAIFYTPGVAEQRSPESSAAPAHAFGPYMEAVELLERWDQGDNLDAAISKFEQALTLDPDFALALARLAEAQRIKSSSTGDEALLDTALDLAQRAATINEDLPPVQIALGRVHLSRGDIDLAHAALIRAIELDANNPAVHIGLGNLYSKMGRLDDADSAYRKAISLNPRKAYYYDSYANFLADQERYDDAIENYQSAVAIAPDYYPAYVNLGSTLDSIGRLSEAIAMYEQAARIQPTYMGYVNLGHAYNVSGQMEKAESATKKALEIDGSDSLAWGNLGFIYWSQGRKNEARHAFEKAVELASVARDNAPRDPLVYIDLASYHAKLGHSDKAMANADTAMTLQPDSAYIVATAAEAYESIGNREKALELLASAIELGYPVNQIARNKELARIYQAMSNSSGSN